MAEHDQPTPGSNAAADASALEGSKHGPKAGKRGKGGRGRRVFRGSVRTVVGVPLVLAILTLIMMRSPAVGWLLKSSVRNLTGCELQISGAYVSLDGRLVVRDFALLAPGVPGEAAKFLSARRAAVDLVWTRALLGEVRVDAVRLYEPVFVLSQSSVDGSVNLASIRAAAGSGGGPATLPDRLPTLDIVGGRLDFTEHDAAGTLSLLRRVTADGMITPRGAGIGGGNGRGVYTVRMQETGQRGMLVDGWVDLLAGSASVQLLNVALDPWKGESIPAAYREIWDRLSIQGRIASTTLDYDSVGGPKARVVLDGVSMNALLPVEPGVGGNAAGTGRDLGLSGVRGAIVFSRAGLSADLTGAIEGQKGLSRLRLDTLGLSAQAPLRATLSARRVSLTKDPEFLPYVPERAREYFQAFSGPTGELDIQLTIARGAATPGEPGAVSVSGGRVNLTGGTAAFHRFPYPFSEIAGTFEFSDQEVRIVGLQGKGPTGARMTATGLITPLTDESMIDITVKAENVPVDQAMLDAMPTDRRRVVEQIFSRPAYERLTQAGVIRPMMTAGPGETGPQPPEFVLGGPASVSVHVFSPKGKDAPWFTTVDVSFEEAGVLAAALPVPVIARGLKIRVTDDDAKVLEGRLSTLSGGTVDLSAAVVFREAGVRVVKPDVRVSVRDLPVDRLLITAVAAIGERTGGVLANVGELRLGGLIGADLRLLEGETAAVVDGGAGVVDAPPDVEYDLSVDVSRVTASPLVNGVPAGFDLRLDSGTLRVDKRRVRAAGVGVELSDASGTAARLNVDAGYGLDASAEEERGRLTARAGFEALDLSRPLEQLLASIAPDAAASIAELRASRRPEGRVWGAVDVVRGRAADAAGVLATTAIDLRVSQGRGVGVGLLGGRLGVDWEDGAAGLSIAPGGTRRAVFERAAVAVGFDGRPCGTITLDGSMGLDLDAGRVVGPADVRAELGGWRLESPIVVPMLAALTGTSTVEKYTRLRPAGSVDASLRLGGAGRDAAAPLELDAELRPRDLAITVDGQRVVLPRMGGSVTLHTSAGPMPAGAARAVAGEVVGLDAQSERWRLRADGAWRVRAAGDVGGAAGAEGQSVDLTLDLSADVDEIDASLRAILPSAAVRAVDALEVNLGRPVRLRDGRLGLTVGPAPGATMFTGTLVFADLGFNIGLPVTGAEGTLSMRVDDPVGTSPTGLELELQTRRMVVSGVRMGEGWAVVRSTARSGEVAVDPIVARVHGGRVAGSARASVGGAGGTAYDLDLVMTGVHLAPVLLDVRAEPAPGGETGPDLDPSRGVVDARLSLSGVAGEGSRRRGSGAIRIADGDVLKLPLILPLIQLSNFQIPSRDRLSYVQSTFHVAGERAVFDRIAVLSRSISIVGSGIVNVPNLTVDMRFNSRGNVRVPLISDVLDAVRNEIITTRITGKLADPKVSSEPLSGTRQMIEGVFIPRDPSAAPGQDEPVIDPRAEWERLRGAGGGEGPRVERPAER